MAEELNRALRNEDRWAEANRCPRELQFHELYQALGNRERQDRIREESERRSCYILLGCPDACECLPEDIGEGKAGQACPNNPYARETALLAELHEQYPLLEIARYYAALLEISGIDHGTITPMEFVVVQIMIQRKEYKSIRAMQSGVMRVVHLKPGEQQEQS